MPLPRPKLFRKKRERKEKPSLLGRFCTNLFTLLTCCVPASCMKNDDNEKKRKKIAKKIKRNQVDPQASTTTNSNASTTTNDAKKSKNTAADQELDTNGDSINNAGNDGQDGGGGDSAEDEGTPKKKKKKKRSNKVGIANPQDPRHRTPKEDGQKEVLSKIEEENESAISTKDVPKRKVTVTAEKITSHNTKVTVIVPIDKIVDYIKTAKDKDVSDQENSKEKQCKANQDAISRKTNDTSMKSQEEGESSKNSINADDDDDDTLKKAEMKLKRKDKTTPVNSPTPVEDGKKLEKKQAKEKSCKTHVPKTLRNLDSGKENLATSATNVGTGKAKLATSETDMGNGNANLATSETDMATGNSNLATSETNMTTGNTNLATSETDMATDNANLATGATEPVDKKIKNNQGLPEANEDLKDKIYGKNNNKKPSGAKQKNTGNDFDKDDYRKRNKISTEDLCTTKRVKEEDSKWDISEKPPCAGNPSGDNTGNESEIGLDNSEKGEKRNHENKDSVKCEGKESTTKMNGISPEASASIENGSQNSMDKELNHLLNEIPIVDASKPLEQRNDVKKEESQSKTSESKKTKPIGELNTLEGSPHIKVNSRFVSSVIQHPPKRKSKKKSKKLTSKIGRKLNTTENEKQAKETLHQQKSGVDIVYSFFNKMVTDVMQETVEGDNRSDQSSEQQQENELLAKASSEIVANVIDNAIKEFQKDHAPVDDKADVTDDKVYNEDVLRSETVVAKSDDDSIEEIYIEKMVQANEERENALRTSSSHLISWVLEHAVTELEDEDEEEHRLINQISKSVVSQVLSNVLETMF